MLRKTLTIFSIAGLLLSLVALGFDKISGPRVLYANPALVNSFKSLGLPGFPGSLVTSRPVNVENVVGLVLDVSVGIEGYSEFSLEQGDYLLAGIGDGCVSVEIWATSAIIKDGVGGPRQIVSATHQYNVSLLLLALLFVIWPAYLLFPHHGRRRRKKLGLCIKCGYDLRGSSERCPECGTGFLAR